MMILAVVLVNTVPEALAGNLSTGGSGLSIPQGSGTVEISSSISKKSFGDTLLAMVNYFISFLGFFATLAFIYAGVLWVLSGGNEEMITKAKKIMTYAALGIVVVILSFSIVRFITSSAGTETVTPPSSAIACTTSADCPGGYNCLNSVCEALKEDPVKDKNSVTGSEAEPASKKNTDKMDETMKGLENDLNLNDKKLSEAAKKKVDEALKNGNTIDKKIENIRDMINNPGKYGLTPEEVVRLEQFLSGLTRLKILRDQLDELRKNMPESKEIITSYDETSKALDDVIDSPADQVKYRRFEAKYKKLKELIRKYPIVKARITATPGVGNVPFTVQLDGLDSVDPTGGTISEYKWSFLDNSGNEVSLGSDPVVLHEFTKPNSYAVRLRASTSQKDADGYKTAADGVSVVRIKAQPPTSNVAFRINGKQAKDFFNVTLKEAQAGLSIDPSPTKASLGRKIEKYEWNFGDATLDVRNSPTTVVHTYAKKGEYTLKLTVTDNLGTKDSAVVKLNVKSLAADITVSPPSSNVNTEFKFSGAGSRSDDGVIKSFDWKIEDADGKKVLDNSESSFTHRFAKPGDYKITLVVTDILGTQDKFVDVLKVLSRDPVASFNYNIPEKNHPNRVEFNAINSYDPDSGDVITFSWDFDGDGDFELVDKKEALATHEYLQVGEYNVVLQVKDAFGKHRQVNKNVSIQSVLVGDIKVDKRATRVGEPIQFTAESSNSVAYLWEFGDDETDSTEETTISHTYDKTGKFTVRMNFFDKDDNDNVDTLRILVGSTDEPVAAITHTTNGRQPLLVEDLCGEGKDAAVVTRMDSILLDAKDSINTDGSSRLLLYDWKLPGGEKSSQKQTRYKFDEINREGECFSVSLVVKDQLKGSLSQEDIAYFKVINQLPEIKDFVITPPILADAIDELVTPTKIKLKVINPKDLDGTIKKYRWWYYRDGFEGAKLGTHSTSTSETNMTITSFGEADIVNRYFFVVEVTDNDNGVYSTVERFGEVSYMDVKNGPNLSPVAEFTLDKTTISTGDSITFISKSYDPQGEELPSDAFRWDFDGDGEFDDTTSGAQVNRQFNTPGEYDVRLKVVHRGLSSSATKAVFVESTDSLPQAAFTYSIDETKVTFDGGHSRFDPSLSDTTLRYEWDFDIDDDANGNGTKDDDVQSTEMQPGFIYDAKANYRVRLKVKDSLGSEGVVVRDINLSLTDEDRLRNTYQSLKVTAPRNPLTTVDIEVAPSTVQKGGTADVNVTVLNADGTPYKGIVYFEVADGSGQFTPNPVTAEDSKASSVFTGVDSGRVRIKVRATNTVYGELTEDAVLQVK